jgi:transposase
LGISRDLLADLRRLDRQVKDKEAEMRDAPVVTRTERTTLPGLGTVPAAKVSAASTMSAASRPNTTSPAAPAAHPWMPPAAATSATVSTPVETAR